MNSTPHLVSSSSSPLSPSSSIHQNANFPPNLEIKSCRLEVESPAAESNSDKSSSYKKQVDFLEDVRSFGIAAKTWDASFRLLDYLVGTKRLNPTHSTNRNHTEFEQRDCHPYRYEPVSPLLINNSISNTTRRTILLDLGSGTCHLPIELARTFSESKDYSNHRIEIIATDLKNVLPLLLRNISRENFADNVKISARALTWGNPEELVQLIHSLDLDNRHLEDDDDEQTEFIITCSDLIFFRWLFGPLIRTLLFLTSPPTSYPSTVHKLHPSHRHLPTATVFIGYKQRSEFLEFPFFPLLGRYFKLERIVSQPKSADVPTKTTISQRSPDFTDDKAEDEEGEIIHLLKATRHPSTLDLDLSLVFDDEDPSNFNSSSLSNYGLSEGADQWELLLFSNLIIDN